MIEDLSRHITFVIPNRGGQHIDFIIDKIKAFYKDSAFLVICQDDNNLFARGQLFNIAIRDFVNTDYICLIDNDLFFSQYLDLIQIYKESNVLAIQPISIMTQVAVNQDGSFSVLSSAPKNPHGKGGITFMSKEAFLKVNGFSNLYLGYGFEDSELAIRCNEILEVKNEIYHIKHESHCARIPYDTNFKIFCERTNRAFEQDGYLDTTYEHVYDERKNGIRYVKVKNIGVRDDFKYKETLSKHVK